MATVLQEPFYLVEGSGRPAIVLVHGAMCDLTNWDPLVPLLAARHTVVRLDLTGHGRSPAEPDACSMPLWGAQVTRLIDRLGLGPVVLVGHSLGGRVTTLAAASSPQSIAGLVLLDCSRTDREFSAALAAAPPPADGRRPFDIVMGPHASEPVRQAVRASIDRCCRPVFSAIGPDVLAWDSDVAPGVYGSLPPEMPVLAIQSTVVRPPEPRRSLLPGEDDGPFLQFLRSKVPHAEIEIVTGAGHYPMMEKPEEIAAMILSFAARVGD